MNSVWVCFVLRTDFGEEDALVFTKVFRPGILFYLMS